MLAVKYREDYSAWPSRVYKNTSILPDGYDELMTEAAYDQLLIDRLPAYEAYKIALTTQTPEQIQAQIEYAQAQKFVQVREAWQGIADKYAGANSGSGITTAQAVAIANSFETVEKYLRLNVPSKALSEIDLITPIEPFLPQAKLTEMKAALFAKMQVIFGIP